MRLWFADGDVTVPFDIYAEAWLAPGRTARMRDFAWAPENLQSYMEQHCSTADIDMSTRFSEGLWLTRWLGVPLAEGPSSQTPTACYNKEYLVQYGTCDAPRCHQCLTCARKWSAQTRRDARITVQMFCCMEKLHNCTRIFYFT